MSYWQVVGLCALVWMVVFAIIVAIGERKARQRRERQRAHPGSTRFASVVRSIVQEGYVRASQAAVVRVGIWRGGQAWLFAQLPDGSFLLDDPQAWRALANQFRIDSVRVSSAAGSGHPTSSLSAASTSVHPAQLTTTSAPATASSGVAAKRNSPSRGAGAIVNLANARRALSSWGTRQASAQVGWAPKQ